MLLAPLVAVAAAFLSQDDYVITKYAVCHPYESRSAIHTKHVKKVTPSLESFRDVAAELAKTYTESVFVDGVTCSVLHKDKILEVRMCEERKTKVYARGEATNCCRFARRFARR